MAVRRGRRRRSRRDAALFRTWPFGDDPFYGGTPDQYPYGWLRSVRIGVLARLILVCSLGLSAIVVLVAVVAGWLGD